MPSVAGIGVYQHVIALMDEHTGGARPRIRKGAKKIGKKNNAKFTP
jgi:hypothetical protein